MPKADIVQDEIEEKTSTDDKINSIEEDGLRKILPVCDLWSSHNGTYHYRLQCIYQCGTADIYFQLCGLGKDTYLSLRNDIYHCTYGRKCKGSTESDNRLFSKKSLEYEKNVIAKYYSEKYAKQYKTSSILRISSDDMESVLKIFNLMRNQCAHDERLYNSDYKNIRVSNIANYLGITNYNNRRIIVAVLYFRVLLNKSYYKKGLSL